MLIIKGNCDFYFKLEWRMKENVRGYIQKMLCNY